MPLDVPLERRRAFTTILILGALSTVSPFAIDMYLPAFPEIARELGTTPARIAISISSYFVGLSLGQMIYGPLLDRFGRRRPLAVGLALYVLAALAITKAHSVEALIALRLVQALGGCAASVGSVAMVRDFFPVDEGAKVFSLLVLILGVSPLLAPTAGSWVVGAVGWHGVFLVLAAIGAVIAYFAFVHLPEGPAPDREVDLSVLPIARTFWRIFRESQFSTYAVAGALSFGGLFVYVAGSPVLFMDIYRVGPRTYGAIFAFLSIGFIGSSQLNLVLARRFGSEQLFRGAVTLQVATGVVALALASLRGGIALSATIAFLFVSLACVGVASPNANSLALAPFDRNVGSASALLGALQIGVGALASLGVGILDPQSAMPVVTLMAATATLGLGALGWGRSRMKSPPLLKAAPADALVH